MQEEEEAMLFYLVALIKRVKRFPEKPQQCKAWPNVNSFPIMEKQTRRSITQAGDWWHRIIEVSASFQCVYRCALLYQNQSEKVTNFRKELKSYLFPGFRALKTTV